MASSHPKASGSSPSLASTGTAILGGTQVSLTLLEKAMDGTNIPFVKGVAGAALEVIKIVKAIQTNREECTNLVERCTSLLVVILGSLTGKSEDAIPDYLKIGVERLTTNFQEVLVELKIIDKRSKKWRAVLYHLDNSDRLKGCSGKLQWAMEEFQVTAKVDSCLKDLERHEELRKGQEKIQESQQELQMGQVVIQDSQQELLKGQANIEENITKGQKEVRDSLSVIQEAMKEQNIGHASPNLPSTVLPPDPKIFGRRNYTETAAKLLLSTTGSKIIILGPGGMGKTSVALKVIHDTLVVERFGENRCWVPCEQATSVPLFIELIAKSLSLPSSSSNDRLADIIAFLKSSNALVILLDNLETPWDIEGQQSNIADVLTAIGSIPSVSFIVTMRGNQPPSSNTIDWTEPRLPSLTQLDLDAAEQTFQKISPGAKGYPEMRTLLEKLDCMPLAITLMAKLSEAGETISDLLEQWKLERTRLLDRPGGDRRNSIEVSIKLSLDSRSVQSNPDAIRLLGVLAMLPAGAAVVRLPDMCPSISGWRAALRVLRGAALVYDNVDKSRIQILSPIQSYMLLHHPLEQGSLQELRASYYKLAPEGKTMTEHPEFKDVAKELAKEETNMEAILLNALHDQNGDREGAIITSLSYSKYLYHNQPRTEIIAEAVRVGRAIQSSTLAECLLWYGAILNQKFRFAESKPLFEEAKSEFTKIGYIGRAGSCNRYLGAILREQGQYDEAIVVMEEARSTLLELGHVQNAAWSLWEIGQILHSKGKYQSACTSYVQARSEFISIGYDLGSRKCLMSLGLTLGFKGDYDAAQSALEEARLGFTEYGDLYNAAFCLWYLGVTLKQVKNYSLSLVRFEEALGIFTQIGNLPLVNRCKIEIDELHVFLATQ